MTIKSATTSFMPQLLIGVGRDNHYFTLRETYMHERYVGGRIYREVRSFHHYNLSQNPDEAIEKAEAASCAMGLRLISTRESLIEELETIKRATAEELEAREQARKLDEEHRQYLIKEQRKIQEKAALEGRIPFGQYISQEFTIVPRGYLTWLVNNINKFDTDSIIYFTANQIAKQVPYMLLPTPDKDITIGEPKQRLDLNVVVLRCNSFYRPAYNGYYDEEVFITTMVDLDSKACLVSFSPSYSAIEGSELHIKATVKKHDTYKDQAQTIVQRVKVLK